ncbi:hypothetical protein DMUE_0908 [Dictyocoela muelleri]|nr:hypothetical protein DMUE_0908 [Dictyocoela muelleri]
MCNWSEEGRLEVLSHIISPEIRSKIIYTGSTDKILEQILSLKYNPSRAHYYYQKLSNLRQENYYRIKKYANNIKDTCQKLAICSDWIKTYYNRRLKNPFL